jgi:DNA-binding NarL/FixJ family response regulator
VRVVLAEDQALLRVGLTRILSDAGHDVVPVADGPSLTMALAEPDVDAAVIDVRLPPTGTYEGLVAAIAVREARPGFPVLVHSGWVESTHTGRLLADGHGAVGYLLKDRVADLDAFTASFEQVLAGGTVLDPEVVAALVAARSRDSPLERLTPREREVLALMAEGRSNAAIAARLFVSEKAVGKHSNSIFTKLDLPVAPDDNRRVRAVLAWLQKER